MTEAWTKCPECGDADRIRPKWSDDDHLEIVCIGCNSRRPMSSYEEEIAWAGYFKRRDEETQQENLD